MRCRVANTIMATSYWGSCTLLVALAGVGVAEAQAGTASSLKRLFNAAESGQATVPERVNEPHAADWVVLSGDKACEKNSEGIKPHRTHSAKSLVECMQSCERRWGCMAVDFYTKTSICNLYRNTCNAPAAIHDGATSYRIRLPTAWQVLSTTSACQSTTPLREEHGVALASDCKAFCERHAGCMAVDYFRSLGLCQLLPETCETPAVRKDGSESHKIQRAITWVQTDEAKGCEGNQDAIKVLSKRHFQAGGIASCKAWCANTEKCRGVDYYGKTNWCLLYEHACVRPLATADGVNSWHLLREGLERPSTTKGLLRREETHKVGAQRNRYWSLIDGHKACQASDDGVKAFTEIQGGDNFGLGECQQACENHGRCTALDWYRETHYCLLYEEACATPHAVHHGASSYQVVRTDFLRPASEGVNYADLNNWRDALLDQLKALDERGEGFVSVPNFEKVIRSTGNRDITEDDIEGILNDVAINSDALVNYEDALGLVQNVVWA